MIMDIVSVPILICMACGLFYLINETYRQIRESCATPPRQLTLREDLAKRTKLLLKALKAFWIGFLAPLNVLYTMFKRMLFIILIFTAGCGDTTSQARKQELLHATTVKALNERIKDKRITMIKVESNNITLVTEDHQFVIIYGYHLLMDGTADPRPIAAKAPTE